MKCYKCGKYFYKNEHEIDVTPPRSKEKYYILLCDKCFKNKGVSQKTKSKKGWGRSYGY